MRINRKITAVSPSLTLEITALAKKMKQQGQDVLNFAAGEPDFDTPNYIKQAALQAIRSGFTKYTPASGSLELKQAIARKFARDNQLNYLPEQIIVSCGAKHALYNILQVLCQTGDEVIIFSPYWVSYPEMIRLAGARAKIIHTHAKDGFKPNIKDLALSITKRTKAIILNSPANPTGCVFSRAQLLQISQLASKKGLLVISDEIYEKIIFDNKRHFSYAGLNRNTYQHTIVVNGLSKAFSMTGWRIGYLASVQSNIISGINKLQSHSTSNPCSISQKAAACALAKSKTGQIRKMAKEFELKRDIMFQGLNQIPGFKPFNPQGAFYMFCNIAEFGLNSLKFSRRLLQEAKVAVVPGVAFGRDDYIRLSFATGAAQIKSGLARIKDWAAKQD
ncbi:pyridoxal phosphate-dependent aminotransferase [Candidatus Omnitrophota bacterium]